MFNNIKLWFSLVTCNFTLLYIIILQYSDNTLIKFKFLSVACILADKNTNKKNAL